MRAPIRKCPYAMRSGDPSSAVMSVGGCGAEAIAEATVSPERYLNRLARFALPRISDRVTLKAAFAVKRLPIRAPRRGGANR